MYRKMFLFLFAACIQVAVLAQTGTVKESIAPEEFQKKMKETKDAVLLDVRTPEEVQQGYIKGAVNMDYRSPDFKDQVSKLDKTKTYFLYCSAGGRGSKAADLMQEMGFKKTYNLTGGITAWQEEKLPVEKKK